MDRLRFGPAGMPIGCKGKKLAEGIAYTSNLGLGAFEVEFVRGVRIRKEDAVEACATAKKKDILLSCHGPYWINCCSPVKEKQLTTIRNIIQTVQAANLLGAYIIVFHPGYYQKLSKQEAFDNALKLLTVTIKKLKEENLAIPLGLETTGKPSQFGSLDEVLLLCKRLDKQGKLVKPVIDFAHIHARENGSIKTVEDYKQIIVKIEEVLGSNALRQLHCHFTEVEFSEKGERFHLAVGTKNSPPFKPLAELIAKHKYNFTIISESPLLERDALKMQEMCQKCKIF